MQKIKLANGLKVIFEHKSGNSVVVELMINVGSNDELEDEHGISHFLEHILFEGTTNRPTNQLITNEIESIGGDFNAYTTNERTCFYVKVLKKHFHKAVDILSDVIQDSLFKDEHIKREKNVVVKEIDMINDEPRFYQWLLLQRTLFNKHPCRYPTYGKKEIIRNLTRDKIIQYFQKHYLPNNMVLSIVGDVKNWRKEIEKLFLMKKGKVLEKPSPFEPKDKTEKFKKERRKIANTYTILGFKTVPRAHPDAYVLEVINGILGRGQSGRMFAEIRSKHGLAYDVGTQNVGEVSFGYFAVYATIDRKNVKLVKKLIEEEIRKLKIITKIDLQESKDFIEGDYLLELEETQKVADQLLFWEQVKDANLANTFVKEIRTVTADDVKRVVDKYLKNGTFVVLEGK
ncbi:MAG TPA: pitrilysin family protein [Candidatus Nanoarchaeia archaeon]|nr:pitrilysin family protein [Candidatus Nanoarchaeia archaeon]